MEDRPTLPSSPATDPAQPMELIRAIVELGADGASHPHWARHVELTELLPGMIWEWAKRNHSSTWRLAKLIEQPSAGRLELLLAGHAFLASAFHGKHPPVPFEVRIRKHQYRDSSGEDKSCLHVSTAYLDCESSAWNQRLDGRDTLNTLLGAFEKIVGATLQGQRPNLGVHSAQDILRGYDAKTCKRIDLLGEEIPRERIWPKMASAVEQAMLRSALDAATPPGAAASTRAQPLKDRP